MNTLVSSPASERVSVTQRLRVCDVTSHMDREAIENYADFNAEWDTLLRQFKLQSAGAMSSIIERVVNENIANPSNTDIISQGFQ